MPALALPEAGLSEEGKTARPKLRKVSFGDGYEFATPDGLNHIRREYRVKWEGVTHAVADTLEAFLTARGGHEAFSWRPSDASEAAEWRCGNWSRKRLSAAHATMTATFTEAF